MKKEYATNITTNNQGLGQCANWSGCVQWRKPVRGVDMGMVSTKDDAGHTVCTDRTPRSCPVAVSDELLVQPNNVDLLNKEAG